MRWLSLALALALAALPPQSAEEKQKLEQKIASLFSTLAYDRDDAQRSAARAELEAIGRPVLPVVRRFLEEDLSRARKAKEKAEAIVETYVPRLDDESIEIRESAMLALIEEGEAILAGLKKHESSSAAEVRARIRQIRETIESRRMRAGRSSRVAEDVLVLYSRLSDPAGAATVAGFFESRYPQLRLQAAKTFHEIALPADLPKLAPLLADPDLLVRAQACASVADLGLDAAVPMLLEVVRTETDLNVWRAALAAMARWRGLWPREVAVKIGDLIPGAPLERRAPLILAYFRAGRISDPPDAILKVFHSLRPGEKEDLLAPWPTPEDEAWLAAVRRLIADGDPGLAPAAASVYGGPSSRARADRPGSSGPTRRSRRKTAPSGSARSCADRIPAADSRSSTSRSARRTPRPAG